MAGPPATAGTGVSRISNMDEDAQADLRWVKVAPVSELAPGRGRAFEVDSIPVLLVNDGGSIFALHAVYDGAPAGLICNSMFFAWYFYGGHGNQPGASWQAGVHHASASVAELKIHLRPPYYQGPSSAGS